LQINTPNLKWCGRIALILLVVVAADALVVLFVPKPLPWVTWIPGLIPVLLSFFVILPMARGEEPSTEGVSGSGS
jgi:peptidoglycan/LPS O-acetylase OafA/YrhL